MESKPGGWNMRCVTKSMTVNREKSWLGYLFSPQSKVTVKFQSLQKVFRLPL